MRGEAFIYLLKVGSGSVFHGEESDPWPWVTYIKLADDGRVGKEHYKAGFGSSSDLYRRESCADAPRGRRAASAL